VTEARVGRRWCDDGVERATRAGHLARLLPGIELTFDPLAAPQAKLPVVVRREMRRRRHTLEDAAEDGLAGESALALDVLAPVGDEERGLSITKRASQLTLRVRRGLGRSLKKEHAQEWRIPKLRPAASSR